MCELHPSSPKPQETPRHHVHEVHRYRQCQLKRWEVVPGRWIQGRLGQLLKFPHAMNCTILRMVVDVRCFYSWTSTFICIYIFIDIYSGWFQFDFGCLLFMYVLLIIKKIPQKSHGKIIPIFAKRWMSLDLQLETSNNHKLHKRNLVTCNSTNPSIHIGTFWSNVFFCS